MDTLTSFLLKRPLEYALPNFTPKHQTTSFHDLVQLSFWISTASWLWKLQATEC